jgi:CHAT domain-containing protein
MLKRQAVFHLCFLLWLFAVAAAGQELPAELTPDRPVERVLGGEDIDRYSVSLISGQFLHVVVDQRSVNITLGLIGPDGMTLIEVNSPNGTQAPESLGFIANVTGKYLVTVRAVRRESEQRPYTISIDDLRPSTSDDQTFVEGQKLKIEGDRLAGRENGQALEKYEQTASQFRLIGDKKRKAALFYQLGGICDDSLDQRGRAIGYYDEALKLYEDLGLKQDIATVLINKGQAYELDMYYKEGLDEYQKALAIALILGENRLLARTYNQLGRVHAQLGDYNRSLEDFKLALKLNQEAKWDRQTSNTLMGLGNVYGVLGDPARGLRYQLDNLELLKQNGTRREMGAQRLNIGNYYLGSGDLQNALEYYQQALSDFESGVAKGGIAYALNNIGTVYVAMGQYEKGIDYIERSRRLKTAAMPKDPGGLTDLGRAYRLQGKYPEALAHYQQSLNIFLEVNDLSAAIGSMNAMSEIYFLQRNYGRSLELANRASELVEKLHYSYNWASLTAAARAQVALGRTAEARKNLETSVARIEGRRNVSEGIEEFEGETLPYQMLVDLSFSENKPADAFAYAERSKARSLLDVLQTGKVDITRSMDVQEKEQERTFKADIALLNNRVSAEKDKSKLDELDRKLDEKRRDFDVFHQSLYFRHPELRVQRGEMTPITVDGAVALLPDVSSAFVEFVVTETKTYALVLTKDPGGKPLTGTYSIDLSQKELADRVEAYRSAIAAGDLDLEGPGRKLYDLLLKSAEARLAGKTNIVIVPDGPLWNLPFQALQTPSGKYLIEQAAVSYAPSLTALGEMQKKNRGKKTSDASLLALGNPTLNKETSEKLKAVFMNESLEPLPEAERLVNTLGKMYGPRRSKIYTGDGAREQTAKAESPKYRIVQFAAHGILNNRSPMYSHIVLSQKQDDPNEDGLLEAWELKELDLKADMVILSACDTARGKIASGEGVIGMTWASFIAGAPTTVASQWSVTSASTTELMLEFHRQLLAGKVSKAQALRRASLRLMKMPKFRHPLYWAGFVLVGDGS